LTQTFSDTQLLDTVNNIVVNPGGVSIQNNFSEVQVLTLPPVAPVAPEPEPFAGNPNPAVSTNPGSNPNPLAPNPGVTGFPGLGGSQAGINIAVGGSPRSIPFQTQAQPSVDPEGEAFAWHTTDEDGEITATNLSHRFGMVGGIPMVGDFDGDGIDDVAVYKDGYWMIDINRNGRWDQEDLLARLGDADDLPVTGDWDGDGKDDIGIYGPIWEGDMDAISHEAGLPHPENQQTSDHKNVPPQEDLATRGARTMKLSAHGRQQADLVDHVFGPDEESLLPIAAMANLIIATGPSTSVRPATDLLWVTSTVTVSKIWPCIATAPGSSTPTETKRSTSPTRPSSLVVQMTFRSQVTGTAMVLMSRRSTASVVAPSSTKEFPAEYASQRTGCHAHAQHEHAEF